MIDIALKFLQTELESSLRQRLGPPPEGLWVSLANVAALEASNGAGASAQLDNQLLLSLVNVEEESAFKNIPNFTKTLHGVRYANPPAYLNLYLLFAANFAPDRYARALEMLSAVIRFFQGNNVFQIKNNTNALPSGFDLNDPDIQQLQLILDMYTMTFEQINHLWGSLGGRQMPFVMYKARLVKIDDRRTSGTGPLIEEIESNLRKMD